MWMKRKRGPNKPKPPTGRQWEVFLWIDEYSHGHGRPPTIQEVAESMEIKPSSAYQHVRLLRQKGYLAEGDGTARCLLPGLAWKRELRGADGGKTEK